MVTAAQVQSALVREGQTLTLKRVVTGQAPITATAHGVVRDFLSNEPNQLVVGVLQGDRNVRLSALDLTNAGWPGPPVKGDQCLIEGKTYTIQNVTAVYLRGTIVAYLLQVRG